MMSRASLQPTGVGNSTFGPRVVLVLVAVVFAAVLFALFALFGLFSGTESEDGPAHTARRTGGSFYAFNTVTVTSDFDVAGGSENVDTIAFWEGPTAAESLMFVTSKNLPMVEVWRYPFNAPASEATALTHSCLRASADSATNGVVVDQETDLLYIASNFSPNVCVFSLPNLAHRTTITSGVTYGLEPSLALMKLPDGSKRLYVSNDTVVYVHDATTGQKLSQFTPAKGLEAMWGDSGAQVLYIPDENGHTGVYAYKPDGTPYTRNGTNILADSAIIDADAEGILEYTCPASGSGDNGDGLIVVSDQIDTESVGNDYEVFDRRTWTHLGTIKLRLPDSSDYVYNTDGIGTTQQASSLYPGGLFTAIQNDSSVVGVGWDKIFDAITAQSGTVFSCEGGPGRPGPNGTTLRR